MTVEAAWRIEIANTSIVPHSDAVVGWQLLPGVGATVTFTGQVRRNSLAGDVSAIDLEHYPGMSERLLMQLLHDAAAQWGIVAGEIVHRVGMVPAGETIVRVSVASAHRREAFEAAAWLMDALKTRAPFWKREWVDGVPCWVEAKASDHAAAARWAPSAD